MIIWGYRGWGWCGIVMVVCKWYICTGKNGDQEQGRISEGVGKSDTMLIYVFTVMVDYEVNWNEFLLCY